MNVQGLGLTQTQGGSWGSSNASPGSAVDKNGNMTYFFVQNSRGDVIKLLNENGDIIRDYEYEPFGKEQDVKTNGYGAEYFSAKWKQEVEDNAIDNPFRFGGEYKDEESGNYYLRARYYDPETQRFIQEDTYSGSYGDPMSQNGYAFCGNNPVNFVDPTGHWAEKENKKTSYDKATRDKIAAASSKYDKARAKGDTAGMTDAHNAADAARKAYNNKSTSSSGSSGGSSKSASVTVIRNGTTLNATIVNGMTTLADGSRPIVGDVVKASSGNYIMTAKGGVKSLLSTDYSMEANVSEWVSFDNTSSNIDPIFLMRLAALARDYGQKIVINSGYRSTQQQANIQGSGVAKPGTSWHEFGGAVDVSSKWLRTLEGTLPTKDQNILKSYGLYKSNTYGNGWTGGNKPPENWHIQPIETLGKFSDVDYKTRFFRAFQK